MSFKPKQSYSESDEREKQSVDFINGLLKGTCAYSKLKCGDKEANIDSYIELLDEDRCIDGKLTVQVKTVSPCNEWKDEFPCPTSLFAYAERTLDVVFLMAVDHGQKVVLWKYISRSLINENRHKADQETITLHFDDTEKLNERNVTETIAKWKSLFLQQRNLIVEAEDLKGENENLRYQLVSAEAPTFTIPNTEVEKIQRFSDAYNRLLDRELCYIKKCCYPDSWKQGIAIFDYQDTILFYALYPIKYGENSLLLKQLPKDIIGNARYETLYLSYVDNKIKDNKLQELVKERISDNIKKVLNKTRITPAYENYIIEYVRDFVYQNHYILNFSLEIVNDYNALKNKIEQCLDNIDHAHVIPFHGYYLRIVSDCINYLLNRGYKGDVELYPPQGKYSVSDSFSAEIAAKKIEIIFSYVYATYTDFIEKNFPYIKDKLDMYDNADYVLINLNYTGGQTLTIYNFYCIDKTNCNNTKVEFSLEQQHKLYEYANHSAHSLFAFKGKTIQYNGQTYKYYSSRTFSAHKFLNRQTCFIDTFHEVFKAKLEQYVKDLQINI